MDGNIIFILKGMKLTVNLYVVTMLFSLPLGILLSLGRVSKNTTLSNIIQVYTWIFRGTPLFTSAFLCILWSSSSWYYFNTFCCCFSYICYKLYSLFL